MRTFIAYRPNSDYAREVSDYLKDFKRRTGADLEEVSPDTRDGDALCRLYDIVSYPSIVAIDDEGRLQDMWSGLPLPLIDELRYYVR